MNIFAGRKLKIFSYIVLAAFIISLIPLVVIAFFNHPSADDFSFSQLPAHTWEQTHSISQTLQALIKLNKCTILGKAPFPQCSL